MRFAATKIGRRGGPTSELAAATDTQPRSNGRTSSRAEAARACNAWTEINEADLIPRGRFLVAASDDSVYTPYAGLVWHRDHDRIDYGRDAKLFFAIRADGSVQVLERYPRAWSEIVHQQASAR